jgi:DNA-binding winged helix-turn-helix (wHTH) protein/tetratricopeptide (TPR) repeat protein/TolB-like protein
MVAVTGSEVVREFAFGEFILTPALMRLDRDGQPVALPLGAFNALLILIENRDRVVTKRELLDRVWAGTAVEENNLNQCISALRKSFGDTRKEARFIATIPGAGYRFVMEVTERERKPDPAVVVSPPVRRHKLGLALALAACVLVLVLLGAAGWNAMLRTETAVLVLPLESFGPRGEDSDYIRKGVATEIEAALARTPGLHVAAGVPDSVLKNAEVREIARKVNARVVLRGQIRENADLLTFTFELVNPETKRILWSDQFDVKRDELAAAESRVVAGVFKTIEPGRTLPGPRRVNPAAHELYLRGRLAAVTRVPADLDKAVTLYERALELDPAYADAYTGIADASAVRAVNGPAPPGVLEKARAAALRSIELDPNSAPAHAALGLVYYADWNWADARRELQQALRLNPYYSITHHRLALLHYVFNNYGEAEAELKRAQDLNPYLTAHAFTLAEVYIGARRYEDAIRVGQQTLESAPGNGYSHLLEMQAYRGMGNHTSALKEMRLASQADSDPAFSALVALAEGRSADAKRLAADHGENEMLWASVYAQLGDRDRMLAALRNLIDNRNVIVLAIKDDPAFDPYRPEPAFQQLIARLHLPASE